MSRDAVYWIWLQQALNYKSGFVKPALELYPDIAELCDGGIDEIRISGLFNQKDTDLLKNYPVEKALAIYRECEQLGYHVITPRHPDYPRRLLEIDDPPAVLYTCGSLKNLDDCLAISMIGTREATPYGIASAESLAYELARLGIAVISGGALGIDTACHRGALKAEGYTIAVLGCGLNYPYLPENAPLRKRIGETGVLTSEYPPGTFPHKMNFPLRNRIISALSLGVVVVEAGFKSGTLITVRHALEQGKDVFAVPGSISSSASKGTNRLIKEGAKPVTDIIDILEEYKRYLPVQLFLEHHDRVQAEISSAPLKKKNTSKREYPDPVADKIKESDNRLHSDRPIPDNLLQENRPVYDCLGTEPRHVNEISLLIEKDVRTVLAILSELEIEGYALSHPGGRFSRK